MVVAKNHRVLGVIYLKDIVKDGIQENFEALRKSGIKTIMITGDNPIRDRRSHCSGSRRGRFCR